MNYALVHNDVDDDLDVEAEFHAAVQALVAETLELFKDNKYIRKLVKKGKFEEVAGSVQVTWDITPGEFHFTEILNATEKKNGLQKLAVDAAFAQRIWNLALRWDEVLAAKSLLPSLSWPVVKA